ncbi:hypothetical protein EX30DRAFT_398660 [Ascodesmis nigricans]|uniref:Mitochondrial K+-H+ exchange-related-domain-containing protein n=1 Tax=Ascodesmis nigricans TaxID=341454 RepID=A0A4S2MJX3_9PEZI|nr:hypothetical protein EX30DRAFT_398660 [Ascodesmis nigricans]
MRLFLIPISTRRTLIFGQRLHKVTAAQPSLTDKASAKAANLWMKWEMSDKGWQKWLTKNGNKLLNQIPFEEWGLKSIPPLSSRKPQNEVQAKKVEVFYPPTILSEKQIPEIVHKLATERRGLHRQRMIWSIIGMPIVAPFALVPVIPNIPFFYLLYRAFSHWKALSGSTHLELLYKSNMLAPVPSTKLDAIYRRVNMNAIVDTGRLLKDSKVEWIDAREGNYKEVPEALLLKESEAQEISQVLDVPALAVECERAVRQVTQQLHTKAEKVAQKQRVNDVTKEINEEDKKAL